MKRLTQIPTNPVLIDRYISIRDSKQLTTRNKLTRKHTFIVGRYNHLFTVILADTLNTLPTIDTIPNPLRIALRSCYDGATKSLNALKKEIKDVQPLRLLKYCPMCGTTSPSTFDHYLPAVRFPEFAVHGLNLIPCCAKCNSTKDDDWLTTTGQRQYLHAYLDDIPNFIFLAATLHVSPTLNGVGATFSLQKPHAINQTKWELIETHFNRLRLLERYNELSNDEIGEIIASCKSYIAAGGLDVRQFLNNQAVDYANVHGENHWLAVLMSALASHADLLTWVA